MNTSEFARICRTERRTIHYYDAIGLLKPDHVQENGYREYSAEQVEQMDTIRILQSSGYTLKEIQKIMQAGSEARAEAFFAARDRIEERIREKTDESLVGNMVSEGTTPRRLTDLIGSLCDLTSGSGDKGTPIVYIQGYFDNYSND